MIKRILFASLPTFFLAFFTQNALAGDMIPTDATKASSVISMIQSQGYRNVFDFDYARGVYIVRAVNQENEVVKIKVNARTNEIMHVRDTECRFTGKTHPVSMLDAVRKAEWAGVRKIYDVDFEGNSYEILGFTVNDRRTEFLVDVNTGDMRRTH